jgi:dienelactone hydrolase
MVLVHGGGGKAFANWAEMWAKRGYATLAMDLSGCGPDGKRTPDGMPDQGHHDKFFTLGRGVRETWPYHAVAAVVRGTSLLAAQDEVDPERIGVTGISWGAYAACIAVGLDDRLKVAVPVYGCGFLHEDSCWLGELAKLSEEHRRLWVESFDPSRYLGQARLPMLWVNGTNDFAYPLDSYQKSYRLPRGPRALCVTVRMPHGHEAGWAPEEIGLFVDHHLRGGTPLAAIGPMRVKDDRIEASFQSRSPVLRGALHYTTDTGAWDRRTWQSAAAEVGRTRVRARLPEARPIVFFLTITDSRGATVSTEHRESK